MKAGHPDMAKAQRRSNREIRKPKAAVPAASKVPDDRPKSQVEMLMQKPKGKL
jgi:hypothetical protein